MSTNRHLTQNQPDRLPRAFWKARFLEFRGASQLRSRCAVVVRGNTVVATMLAPYERPGDYATEYAAAEACRQFNIDPLELVWIEHRYVDAYTQDTMGRARIPGKRELFHRVHFTYIVDQGRFQGPQWTPMNPDDVKKVL